MTCHADSALTLAQVSTLNFVDLAGSERSTLAAKDDGDNKLRQTEGSAINKSLLTLGNVIRGLGDGRVGQPCSASGHIVVVTSAVMFGQTEISPHE